ncbi:hypothetical protein OESDEN_02688 [Oesophagostomum dentatum]|uniref:BUB1 N-terminal domain-containing protein n=1 Tax=Oesophagostomum dentatum TaxID=61180 RepID=A0A0B1TMK6_OESDE|nr:hypothetical protein OESDEN_02688 [Oesophagostomum dentatum]
MFCFSCIKEALSSSSPDVSIDFVCGTIILFEKHFGQKNKAAMQKILKEAIENFGPETPFSDNESMLPVYSMLTKYSKSLSVSEIFERLYRKGSYKKCAKFYVEWCRSCREIPRNAVTFLQEVLDLAYEEDAEPVSLLQLAKEEIRAAAALPALQDDSRAGNSSSHDRDCLRRKPHLEKSAKRALFSGRAANVVDASHRLPEREDTSTHDFVVPDPGTSWRVPMTSDSPPPSNFEVSARRSSSSSESIPSPDPNAENM